MEVSDQKVTERRSWLLLLLALVPTAGVLAAGVWTWSVRGAEIREFQQAFIPIETSVALFRPGSDLVDAEASLLAASLPGADAQVVARARQDHAKSIAGVEQASIELPPLVAKIQLKKGEGNINPALELIGSSIGMATGILENQEAGQAVGPDMRFLATMARDNAIGVSLPYIGTADNEVGFLYDQLVDTINYHDQYDSDRGRILEAVAADDSALVEVLHVIEQAPLRQADWNDLVDGRTFSLVTGATPAWALTASDPERPLLLDRSEPVAQLLGSYDNLRDAEQRNAFLLELFAIADDIEADVELESAMLFAEAERHLARLKLERMFTVVASAVMALLGLALSWLTVAEVRHRRQVERAHGAAIDKLADKAHRDPTTGAWNRRRLESELKQRLAEPGEGQVVAMAYVDLDYFKAINDVWGHHTGDEVLKVVTSRLEALRYGDASFELTRFGGDEFVLYAFVAPQAAEWLQGLGETIIDTIGGTIAVAGRAHSVGASAGITMSVDSSTLDSLLLEADSSLILAKREQRGTAVVYDRDASRTGELVQALPNALEAGEITCYLQPVFDSTTGCVVHVEALARWIRPSGEMVSPGLFVPLVESFGLADRLTSCVMRSVGAIVSDPKLPDVRVWINLSPLELEVANFSERFTLLLDSLNIPASRVGVEITETAAIRDPQRLGSELQRLKAAGVMIAIDDFGNGYSPLGYLRDLPVDIVKLDRSLIANIDTDCSNQHLVTGVVGMLREHGTEITAEGVERVEEEMWLRDHGVVFTQGFLRGRPAAPDELDWDQLCSPTPKVLETTR